MCSSKCSINIRHHHHHHHHHAGEFAYWGIGHWDGDRVGKVVGIRVVNQDRTEAATFNFNLQ